MAFQDKINQLINKIKSLPQNQLIAIGAIILGLIFIIIALLIW